MFTETRSGSKLTGGTEMTKKAGQQLRLSGEGRGKVSCVWAHAWVRRSRCYVGTHRAANWEAGVALSQRQPGVIVGLKYTYGAISQARYTCSHSCASDHPLTEENAQGAMQSR